ncbi:hypothetical protein ABT112_15845, partial [Streptomyces sp. NPDC002055]|uniref:hypothetical protein n=1 Tax=Streptomyces sp. NPDC002055 TaxID=3154534 RepID=UPI00331C3ECE
GHRAGGEAEVLLGFDQEVLDTGVDDVADLPQHIMRLRRGIALWNTAPPGSWRADRRSQELSENAVWQPGAMNTELSRRGRRTPPARPAVRG